jgi:hypothetical protein
MTIGPGRDPAARPTVSFEKLLPHMEFGVRAVRQR